MTKSEYVLTYRKMQNKLHLAINEVADVQFDLARMGNLPASNFAGKAYDQIHDLIGLLKWAEKMAIELSSLANE